MGSRLLYSGRRVYNIHIGDGHVCIHAEETGSKTKHFFFNVRLGHCVSISMEIYVLLLMKNKRESEACCGPYEVKKCGETKNWIQDDATGYLAFGPWEDFYI